jgi:exopolyphosphatase/guanosine-5'-triphosphate,3'-diphosphate pyrophosphatase
VAEDDDPPDVVAAVDLGSNSFHMVIARVVGPDLRILDRMRDHVQLAAGLDDRKRISAAAQERALQCLERFGQRLRDLPTARVRAVGTSALRRAKNSRELLSLARRALGHPIEVVSGREEARLIYLGVSHSLPDSTVRRLVVDIGGGSTECILGQGFESLQEESLHMGCIGWGQRFFPRGQLGRQAFKQAEVAAGQELETIEEQFRAAGWSEAVGSSGTILSIADVLRANGWSEHGITRQGLRKLRKVVMGLTHTDQLLGAIPGLKPERAGTLPGGLAILCTIFEELKIEHMTCAEGAMREGVLYDLLGRARHEDVRDRTIRRFEERFHVDLAQVARVEHTALSLLEQVVEEWKLERVGPRSLLAWAARLHEIGLAISYSHYQRHGAYLVANADMPGFSIDGKRVLSALILGHRRKLAREWFPDLLEIGSERLLRLCILLRLAVLLNRSRTPRPLPPLRLVAKRDKLSLEFPAGWLEQHPLTCADLAEEAEQLADVGYRLRVSPPLPATTGSGED